MIAFGVAMIFTLIGTFTIKGDLVIHWSGEGIPNNSAGKWILWTLLLMAFLSIFTHGSLSKKCPGRNTLSIEMAGALSSGLVSMWSIINIILVTYNHYPTTAIPIIGTIAIVLCYILFTVIAYIRDNKA